MTKATMMCTLQYKAIYIMKLQLSGEVTWHTHPWKQKTKYYILAYQIVISKDIKKWCTRDTINTSKYYIALGAQKSYIILYLENQKSVHKHHYVRAKH